MTYLVKTKQNDHSIQFVHYSDHQFIMNPDVGKAQFQLNRFQFSNYLLQCLLIPRDYIEISNIIHWDSPGNKVIYYESNKSEYIVPLKGLGIQYSRAFQNNRIHLDSPGNKVMYCESNESEKYCPSMRLRRSELGGSLTGQFM